MRRPRWENFFGPEIDFESDLVAGSGLRKFWSLGFSMHDYERRMPLAAGCDWHMVGRRQSGRRPSGSLSEGAHPVFPGRRWNTRRDRKTLSGPTGQALSSGARLQGLASQRTRHHARDGSSITSSGLLRDIPFGTKLIGWLGQILGLMLPRKFTQIVSKKGRGKASATQENGVPTERRIVLSTEFLWSWRSSGREQGLTGTSRDVSRPRLRRSRA